MEIINLGSTLYTNYLMRFPCGCILVDAGNKTSFEDFKKKLKKNNILLADIKYLFLTHSHDDHVSYLKPLLENTNITVIAHSNAVERLKSGRNINGDSTTKLLAAVGKIINKNGTKTFEAVDISGRMVAAEQNPDFLKEQGFDITIIPLLGHTTDNIGMLTGGVLFAGDALFNGFPAKGLRTLLVENRDDYISSWKKILELKPSVIYVGHGTPIVYSKIIKVSADIDKLKLYK